MKDKNNQYPTAGWYEISEGNFKIRFAKKPNFIKRFCMKHFLGFTWTDGTFEDWDTFKPTFKSEEDAIL
jgi:hypothetical protein